MTLGVDRTPVSSGRTTFCPWRNAGQEVRQSRRAALSERGSRNRSSRGATCRASLTLERLPLSSYDFPKLPSGAVESTPLETAVKEAVKHIEQAPFLQLQQGPLASRHDVSESVLQDPQAWDSVANTLEQRGAEIVLLVHRLDPVEPERVKRKVHTNDSVMTGITSASQQGGLESFAELLRTETAGAEFSGRVGDCCDEDVVSQVVPFTRHSHHHQKHSSTPHNFQRSQSWKSERANYWGVVLQSSGNERESGCYVLKTVHSGVGDCTCVHWSLTRVRQGASFFEQLNSAWLL